MEVRLSEAEVTGDRRGKVAAGIGFVLFVILLLVPIFFHLNPPPGQPGIAVLLAFDDAGSGDDPAPPSSSPAEVQPEPAPTPPPTPEVQIEPEPVTPPPTPATTPERQPEREVIQQETAAEIAIRKRKAQEEARKREAERLRQEQEAEVRRREDAAAQAAREQAAREQREREAREAAIAEAKAKEEAARQRREADAARLRDQLGGSLSNSGGGSGNTSETGTQGDPNGVPGGAVTAGSGRVSGGLGGRGLVSSPAVRESSQASGTVVVNVCVGADGKVISAKFSQTGSNTSNPQLIRAAENNAKTWKFSASATAPPSQCGKITYTFKVQ